MIISIDIEKAFDKNPAPIYDKNSQQNGVTGNLNIIKAMYDKATASIILNEQNL